MCKVPDTSNESQRLSALLEYQILDTPQEAEFDSIARLAAALCQAPMAAVSFIDTDRQWLKARYGIFITETPRDEAICAYTILNPGLHIVPDTLEHRTYRNFPFVKGGPRIRFYAGIPITSHQGRQIGTLCVMDHYPRDLNSHQRQTLLALGSQVETLLEHRRIITRLRQLQDTQTRLLHHLLADVTSAFSATGTFLNLLSDQPERTTLLSLTPMASRQFHRTLTILNALVEWGGLRTMNRIREWRPVRTHALLTAIYAELGQHPATHSFIYRDGQQVPDLLSLPDSDLHFILKYLLLWLADGADDGEVIVSFGRFSEEWLNIRLVLVSATISAATADLPGRLAPDAAELAKAPTQDILLRLAVDILFNGKGEMFLNKQPGRLELTIDFPLREGVAAGSP